MYVGNLFRYRLYLKLLKTYINGSPNCRDEIPPQADISDEPLERVFKSGVLGEWSLTTMLMTPYKIRKKNTKNFLTKSVEK